MALLKNDKPNILLLPSSKNESKLYTIVPEDGSGDFTVSRNGTATYFDKDGLLKTAQPNEPRFDFDPLTGEFKGVLVEPAATNILLRSENHNISPWFGTNVIRNSGFLAPDGSNNAVQCIANDTNGVHWNQNQSNVSLINGQTVSCSVFVKFGGYPAVNFAFLGLSPTVFYNNITFNFITEILTGHSSGQVEKYKNGWYKLTFTNVLTSNHSSIAFRLSNINELNTNIFIGDNVSGFISWGAQLEVGPVATSYIPTVASQVTRPADVITIPNYSSLFGERNSRLININDINKAFINESDFQLPNGYIKYSFEYDRFLTEDDINTFSATTVTYGVRQDIKTDYIDIVNTSPILAMIAAKVSSGILQSLIPSNGSGDFISTKNSLPYIPDLLEVLPDVFGLDYSNEYETTLSSFNIPPSGSIIIQLYFPENTFFNINDFGIELNGLNTIIFNYSPTSIELIVNGQSEYTLTDTFDFTNMDFINLGHNDGFFTNAKIIKLILT